MINQSIKIIQISDTHLFADDNLEIFGVKSNLRFKEVLEKFVKEDSFDTNMIILSGDISQDETTASYQKIAIALEKMNIPVYWTPGNHDNIMNMKSSFEKMKNFTRGSYLTLPHWNIIFLNSKRENTTEGYLAQSELEFLKNKLAQTDKKTAIVMHHHPAPVGTPLIDQYILSNREEFWHIVTDTKAELVICGHVHGEYQFKYNNINIESGPATCFQLPKGIAELKINTEVGYKIYYLHAAHYNTTSKIW